MDGAAKFFTDARLVDASFVDADGDCIMKKVAMEERRPVESVVVAFDIVLVIRCTIDMRRAGASPAAACVAAPARPFSAVVVVVVVDVRRPASRSRRDWACTDSRRTEMLSAVRSTASVIVVVELDSDVFRWCFGSGDAVGGGGACPVIPCQTRSFSRVNAPAIRSAMQALTARRVSACGISRMRNVA